jgi:hypothetical protein
MGSQRPRRPDPRVEGERHTRVGAFVDHSRPPLRLQHRQGARRADAQRVSPGTQGEVQGPIRAGHLTGDDRRRTDLPHLHRCGHRTNGAGTAHLHDGTSDIDRRNDVDPGAIGLRSAGGAARRQHERDQHSCEKSHGDMTSPAPHHSPRRGETPPPGRVVAGLLVEENRDFLRNRLSELDGIPRGHVKPNISGNLMANSQFVSPTRASVSLLVAARSPFRVSRRAGSSWSRST